MCGIVRPMCGVVGHVCGVVGHMCCAVVKRLIQCRYSTFGMFLAEKLRLLGLLPSHFGRPFVKLCICSSECAPEVFRTVNVKAMDTAIYM